MSAGVVTVGVATPLEVAVNLLWCDPGRVGGSEEYLARQWRAVSTVDPDRAAVRPTIHASSAWARVHADLAATVPTVTAPVDVARRPVRIAMEHTWLARRTRGADLVHHGGGTVPAVGSGPVLLTIHDLQYVHHPEYFSATKRRYLASVVPASVRRAAVVATPSAWVRSTVIDAFGVDPDRVMVVPHGVPVPPVVSDQDRARVRRRYGIGDRPFVVYPAITHPHKRHALLLEALAQHVADDDLVLVLLGGAGAAEPEVAGLVRDLGVAARVVRPGRVPDADRDALLAESEALVFPSRYEGFGAPLVEAMALGTPVICSDHAAVAEVVADAALVTPDDPAAWAEAIERVRSDRDGWQRRGRDRAAVFTDEASAHALVDACRRAVTVGRVR